MSGFRINTNTAALSAMRQGNLSATAINRSIERLSSGQSINRAADDSAGLAITERMRSQVEGLQQGSRNVQDGKSLLQTAEGGLSGILDSLHRMRSLAVQAANDTLTDEDRALVQLEVDQQLEEIDRQASTVTFNGKRLLDGSAESAVPGTGELMTENFIIAENFVNLTNDAAFDSLGLDISSDGSTIVSSDAITGQISTIPAGGGAKTNVAPPVIGGGDAHFSPDGTRIVFQQDTGGGNIDIFTMNADGSNIVNVTSSLGNERNPRWMPDGTQVLYRKDNGDIAAKNADGTGAESVIVGGLLINSFDISLDGTRLAYERAGTGIVTRAFGGGPETVISPNGNNDSDPVFSPDGSLIEYFRAMTAQELIRNADGTGPEIEIRPNGAFVAFVDFFPDMRRVAILDEAIPDIISVNSRLFVDLANDVSDPNSLIVQKNGATLTLGADYTLDDSNSIRFTTTGIPDVGDTVDVTYLTGAEEGIIIHDGADKDQIIALSLPEARVQDLFPSGTPDVSTRDSAENAISLIDGAITRVIGGLAEIGAQTNRLEAAYSRNQVQVENTSASRSRIRDLNFADEIVGFTKRQIIQQAGVSALAQANVAPQSVLQLLQ